MGNLADVIARDAGYEDAEQAVLNNEWRDAVVPGACVTCEMVHDDCEPDMRDGFCEDCGTPTVKSVLILLGVI